MPPTDKLTDSLIQNAKPGQRPVQKIESEKQTSGARKGRRSADTIDNKKSPEKKSYRLWDGGGLYLEVDPAGGKWWRWKYRLQGKEKRLSLGVYPEVSLAIAREQRQECRRLLAQGTDPAEHRKAVKKSAREGAAEDSFEVIAREWLKKFIDPMSESHRTRVYARFVNDIFPAIGRRPIAEITPNELLNVILKIEERGAKDTAHRTLGSCSQVFRYAVSSKRCQNNITRDLRGALALAKAGHFAAVIEPDELAGILRGIDGYRGTLAVQCALRLAPLVFVRPGELRQAKWKSFKLDDAEWLLQLSKRKDGKRAIPGIDNWLIVPLSRQAVAILREMHSVSGDGQFVFPGNRYEDRCISDNAIHMALRRMYYIHGGRMEM